MNDAYGIASGHVGFNALRSKNSPGVAALWPTDHYSLAGWPGCSSRPTPQTTSRPGVGRRDRGALPLPSLASTAVARPSASPKCSSALLNPPDRPAASIDDASGHARDHRERASHVQEAI